MTKLKNEISRYIKDVAKALGDGRATEHTYRPALKALIEGFGKDITATNEPKREKCGAPDFIITQKQIPLGYFEAKDIGKPLESIESDSQRKEPKTENGKQLKRYRKSLTNLILTDYLEFRWYREGELRLTARLGRVDSKGKVRHDEEGTAEVIQLISSFLTERVQSVGSPKELANRMAAIGRLIHDIIIKALDDEDRGGSLHSQMEGFREVLLHSIKPDEFADMYAQTICYGLFAARCNHEGKQPFTRQGASFELPKTNPFLRKMFSHMAGPELDDRIVWAVDDLAELLNRADMSAILRDFGKRTRREDPVVHFYETFLAAYDPKMREARGVYYTPEPVVSYIVRSVDHILKNDFGIKDGLADKQKVVLPASDQGQGSNPSGIATTECHKVLILDPAVGTGTFLYNVIDHIHESFKGNEGMWSSYVSQHLLPRLFGFELLMAPYAVAHMKLGLQLQETDYDFKSDERIGVFLTNTLEEAFDLKGLPAFAQWVAEEANEAGRVKQDLPVMVVLGNPPYSGHSMNRTEREVTIQPGQTYRVRSKGGMTARIAKKEIHRKEKTFIGKLLQDYFQVDGQPLGERNPKWLNDDYVKFIRFAQHRIEQTGYGILAFITNHGYLDNPTFRGMRRSLMHTFDDIYILDLHGNTKKKERCPDGSKDENVFDIQQGVAIGIFVKRGTGFQPVDIHGQDGHATVRHAHLWGLRKVFEQAGSDQKKLAGGKYHWLGGKDVAETEWRELSPHKPFYLFVPKDLQLVAEYEMNWSIKDAMPHNGVGMTTARDHFVTDFEEAPLIKRVCQFRYSDESNSALCSQLGIPMKKGWNISKARKSLQEAKDTQQYIKKVTYRPFDNRLIFYHDALVWRTVKVVMRHMLTAPNLAITIGRAGQVIGPDIWDIVFCTKFITEFNLFRRGGNNLFPLYLYPDPDDLFNGAASSNTPGGRRANLSPEFIDDLTTKVKLTFIPDGKGDLGLCGTGFQPVGSHGQDGHATEDHGQDGHATEVNTRRGAYLPHWTQEGATYFVTFRLTDSLPQSRLEEMRDEQEREQKAARRKKGTLPLAEKQKQADLLSERVEKFLDQGVGKCHLSRPEIAGVVHDALFHYDRKRYHLLAWCIMPNHVHAVLRPEAGHKLSSILHSWKSFAANKANKILGRKGRFWQPEYYDHLIRDEKDLKRCMEYTYNNPEKAGLEGWKWQGYGDCGTGFQPVDIHGQDGHATGTFGPEDVFNYIYAVFHSPTYRTRYADFLKIDFPRLPLTSRRPLFRSLCNLGSELVALHLMEKDGPALAKYPVALPNDDQDKDRVNKVRYSESTSDGKSGRVWINRAQYFEGVPPEVWEFHIGGYQVCHKWLKDRKGRVLTNDDLSHYQKIVSALSETIRLMAEIDNVIDKNGGWPIK